MFSNVLCVAAWFVIPNEIVPRHFSTFFSGPATQPFLKAMPLRPEDCASRLTKLAPSLPILLNRKEFDFVIIVVVADQLQKFGGNGQYSCYCHQ